MTISYIALGLFILLAYTAEAVTGFGSIVIALSLGALFFPIDWLQTVLVPLNICMTGFLSWKHRRFIDKALLQKLVLPFMFVGTLAGLALQPLLGGIALKISFAVLILWFAVRELLKLRAPIKIEVFDVRDSGNGAGTLLTRLLVAAAGITHGLFASGGPLLVYALAGTALDKARLRATLIVVWFSLNAALTAVFLAQGRLAHSWTALLYYLPLIPIGIVLGEHLHHRIDEQSFRRWIYRLLVIAALALLLATLLSLR
ncbi:MAG: sulfite exporter TauE/SafE family protein [Alcanivoracaceae bacterium]|nr:sulfite exporter TauE/SafE family protein [Alcanivoracaceae bacterium]